jgi:hypothetical protein
VGYLVRWRRLLANPETRQQLTDLVGNQAIVYLGNASGDVWTDLTRPASKPPIPTSSTLQLSRNKHAEEEVMALGKPIPGTPWFVIVEFPEKPLLSRSNQFLRRSIIIGVLVFILGVSITFWSHVV